MLETRNNSFGDAISEMAKYCENEHDFLDLVDSLVEEVNLDTKALYLFGSRNRQTNKSDSDIDIMAVNPAASQQNYGSLDRLPRHDYLGHTKPLNKGGNRGWIDLIRIRPEAINYQKMTSGGLEILESAQLIWHDPSFDPDLVTTTIEQFRDYQLQKLIDQLEPNETVAAKKTHSSSKTPSLYKRLYQFWKSII